MKKILILIFLIFIFIVSCNKKDNIEEYSFKGIIAEINENSILVEINENEEEYKSSDLIYITITDKIKDNNQFKIGDEIEIFYDGLIKESYPAQISNVFSISVVNN